MLKLVLLFLALSGLHAVPIKAPKGSPRSASRLPAGLGQGVELPATGGFIPDDFRQGTEPSRKFIVDLNTGLAQEHVSEMDRRIVPVDVPVKRIGGGWLRVEELPVYDLPDGFRLGTEPKPKPPRPEGFKQGTEPVRSIPEGFRQGTEPSGPKQEDSRQRTDHVLSLPDGFRQRTKSRIVNLAAPNRLRREGKVPYFAFNDFKQGTKASMSIQQGFRKGTEPRMFPSDVLRLKAESFRPLPDGFRYGIERSLQIPEGFRQGTERSLEMPVGFRQGTERSLQIPKGFRQGTERSLQIPEGFRQGTEHSLEMPVGFRQGTERSLQIPEGFRQGTERSLEIPEGFRQGTEPSLEMPVGFRQGTERSLEMPVGFRQGTERSLQMPVGFRQGTEHSVEMPVGFRQGTEHSLEMPVGFRQGTERSLQIPEGFRQGTEPSQIIDRSSQQTDVLSTKTQTGRCMGHAINGICFEFHPTPRTFLEAQIHCRASMPNAELASVTSRDLHSRLVSLVTNGGQNSPVLTWLGATVTRQQASWVDGSEWSYSDWMPGHTDGNTGKSLCVEMFKIDERWWTVADCDLKRASICSYPLAVREPHVLSSINSV